MKSNELRLVIAILLAIGLVSSLMLTFVIYVSNNDLVDQVLAFKKQAQEAELALHKQRSEMRLKKDVILPERQATSKAELKAIKSAFANWVVLRDLEAYYNSQKNWSTQQQVGVATLQLLANGGRDEATIASIQKALDMAQLKLKKNVTTKTPASFTR